MRSILSITALLLAASCASPQGVTASNLLRDPNGFDGRTVEIRGAVVARFEATFICDNLEQVKNETASECIQLEPAVLEGQGLDSQRILALHKHWVVVRGTFLATPRGHTFKGQLLPTSAKIVGNHPHGDVPPELPEPSANNSFKPRSLRGRGVVWQIVTTPRPQSAPA